MIVEKRSLTRRTSLEDRESFIVSGIEAGRPYREIAADLGLSMQRVGQIAASLRNRGDLAPRVPLWAQDRKVADLQAHFRAFESSSQRVASFWSKVDRSAGPNGCWPWTAGAMKGYGRLTITNEHGVAFWLAHRIAFSLANGGVPLNLFVRHKCDNPPCCNPAHLESGTGLDNVRDMIERGGFVPPPVARGAAQWRAKVSEDEVSQLRERYACGVRKCDLAREFGLTPHHVHLIVSGRSWRHVS